MRESCSCGAACQSIRAKNVREWRYTHHCPDRPEPAEQEPDRQGAFAQVERAAQYDHDPAHRIIGFRANEYAAFTIPSSEGERTGLAEADLGRYLEQRDAIVRALADRAP